MVMNEMDNRFSSHYDKVVVETREQIRILVEFSFNCSCDRFLAEVLLF